MYDADLKGYFDSIPHEQLMACVRMRIADRSGVEADPDVAGNAGGGTAETKGGAPKVSRSQKGTPQGGVISPLLANLYLHWFDKVFHRPEGRRTGPRPSWCAMPMTLSCWRATAEPAAGGLDRSEAGSLDGIGDQSGQDAGGGV